MKYLKFSVAQRFYNEGGNNSEDSWSRDSYSGDANIDDVFLSEKESCDCYPNDEQLIYGDTVHVLMAVYTTGDSFGHDGGQYEVLFASGDINKVNEKKEFYKNVTDFSVPWNGYFENLDDLKISTHIIN